MSQLTVKEPKWRSSLILQFRARFCRNCKFFFSYMESGPGGIFWPFCEKLWTVEHPKRVVSFKKREDNFSHFSFPRYGHLKMPEGPLHILGSVKLKISYTHSNGAQLLCNAPLSLSRPQPNPSIDNRYFVVCLYIWKPRSENRLLPDKLQVFRFFHPPCGLYKLCKK